MPRIDPLHQLIRSLTKSEKRYFKLFAKMQGGEKNYLRLFDAIDRLETYDTATIRREFEGEAFTRQLSVAKNYLRGLVMKSLRLYHSGGSARTRLHEMLVDVEILTDKGLRSQAKKIAEKGEMLARKLGEVHLEFEGMVRRQGLDRALNLSSDGLDQMESERTETLDRLANLDAYALLIYRVARLVSRGNDIRSSDELAELDRLMESPLLQSSDRALTARARMRYHWIHAGNHYARGRFEESMQQSIALAELIESDPDYLPHHISLYTASLSNILLSCEQLGDTERFDAVMQKLRNDARSSVRRMKRPSREEAAIFTILYSHLLSMHARRGTLDEALALVPEIDRALDKHEEIVDPVPRLRLLLHLAALYASTGNAARALEVNNRIIFEPEPIAGAGIFRAARLLNLVLHYELGNDRLLATLLGSTERFFRAREPFHTIEQRVIDLLRRLRKAGSEDRRVELFAEFAERLEALDDDPLEAHPPEFFSYVEWAQKKSKV